MAIVPDPRFRALDSNGNPISGATLTVYVSTTTTPAAIFRDAALTVPMSNPTSGADKANAAGWFPVVYAAEGAVLDVTMKDAAGIVLTGPDTVVSLGSNTGTISRDFTNARFQARGSGGTVYIEAGDPLGDDVGGTGVLGGWAGTQADSWAINAALVNIIGRLKEGGYKLPGVVRSEAVTFSGSTHVDIPLTNDPTGVRAWDIELIDFVSSSGPDTLSLRFSYDGGATFDSGSDYLNTVDYSEAANALATGNVAAQTSGLFALTINTPANQPAAINMRVVTPNSGSNSTLAFGKVAANWSSSTTTVTTQDFVIRGAASLGRATHVRILATGNLSGLYRVIPARGLGEA